MQSINRNSQSFGLQLFHGKKLLLWKELKDLASIYTKINSMATCDGLRWPANLADPSSSWLSRWWPAMSVADHCRWSQMTCGDRGWPATLRQCFIASTGRLVGRPSAVTAGDLGRPAVIHGDLGCGPDCGRMSESARYPRPEHDNPTLIHYDYVPKSDRTNR